MFALKSAKNIVVYIYVGIFNCHLVYFTAIWYILWHFGIFCGHLVFFPVLVFCTKKNLATVVSVAFDGSKSVPVLHIF
jgi:hypothetical protein